MELKDLRDEIDLTQKEAADKLGISKDYLYMIENQKRTPSIKLMNKMAKLYGVDVMNIFLIINRTYCSESD